MDRLTTSLEARNAEVETRAASANALHAVSQAIASLADLEEILEATVEQRPDLARRRPRSAGPDRTGRRAGPALDERPGRRRSIGAGRVAAMTPADSCGRRAGPTMLAAPLRRGGTTIGTLAVAGRSMPSHQVGDVETLSSLANQAAIAIENHRLEGELRALAVQHERERIAREIHDGLAQLLGYVNTKSQAVEGLLEAGRLDEAMVQMAELSAAARSNYVDVREAIQGLSEPVGAEVDLGAEVRDYADRFAEASKLVVSVHLEPGLETTGITPAVRDEVFGIVREALTNVRKHAAARRVSGRDRPSSTDGSSSRSPTTAAVSTRTDVDEGPGRLAALRDDDDATAGGRHRRPDRLDERPRCRARPWSWSCRSTDWTAAAAGPEPVLEARP